MISADWKNALKKEKALLNQLVFLQKQGFSAFREDSVALFFKPYYGALSRSVPNPKSSELVLKSFEVLLLLLQKGILRDPTLDRETILLKLLGTVLGPLNENFELTVSYLFNALSKLKQGSVLLFLKRLDLVSKELKTLEDFKLTLLVLAWLCGHPEYRKEALSFFEKLPATIQTQIASELALSPKEFVNHFQKTPFGSLPEKTEPTVKYKIISGHPLLGGNFPFTPTISKEGDYYFASSGEDCFSIYFDLFGENVFSSEKKSLTQVKAFKSTFWKTVATKIFEEKSITSLLESESYMLLTVNFSYNVYLFYLVTKK
jgi:hypothetical protein